MLTNAYENLISRDDMHSLYALVQSVIFDRTYGSTDWDAALRLLRGPRADWGDPENQRLIDGLLDSAVALGTALRLVETTKTRALVGLEWEATHHAYLDRTKTRREQAVEDHFAAYSEFLHAMAEERRMAPVYSPLSQGQDANRQ